MIEMTQYRCSFNMTKDQDKWVRSECKKAGVPISEFVRRVIEKQRDPKGFREYMKNLKEEEKSRLKAKKEVEKTRKKRREAIAKKSLNRKTRR